MTRRLSKTVNSRPRDSAWDASALREAVETRGLHAEDLSVATGKRAETARRWLTGRTVPSVVQGKAIATLLGVPIESLLPGAPVHGGSGPSSSGRSAKR